MPTVMLTGSASAQLPRLPITIFVEAEGLSGALEILADPALDVRRPRAGMVVLPNIDGPVTITARPANGSTFATPTVLHLTAIVNSPGSDDPERVVIPGVTVSGLPVVELLQLSPLSGHVVLSRPAASETLVLSDLGDAALVATRAALGRSRAPEQDRMDIGIVVDGSVSMVGAVRSGAVADAVDLITGVVPVIGRAQHAEVHVALAPVRRIEAAPAHQGRAVTDALTGAELTTGFETQTTVDLDSELTFIVTDGLPVDHDRLDRHAHLVVLGEASCESGLRAMTSAPFTVVPTDHGRPGLLNPTELNRIVRSLTADWSTAPSGRA